MESFFKRHLNEKHCFLCGVKLNKTNRTDEHVFPKWLLERHELWNSKIRLLNGTFIPYRQMVIPCCKRCNSGPLSNMEGEVSQLLTGPYRKPTAEDEFRLFQWCSKILYGLMHREMVLLLNRKNASDGPIVEKPYLEGLTTFHHFMSSIRRP